jgi:arginase
VPNGLTVEEAKVLNVELARSPKVCAWEIAEVNPTLDSQNSMAENGFEVMEATAKVIAGRAVEVGS